MWPPAPVYERFPQLWFLLGLLFIATGLYLGFEFSLSFLYILVGIFCCVFGIAIYVLRLMERPRAQAEAGTRKPIEFDSAEPGHALSQGNHVPVMEHPASE